MEIAIKYNLLLEMVCVCVCMCVPIKPGAVRRDWFNWTSWSTRNAGKHVCVCVRVNVQVSTYDV